MHFCIVYLLSRGCLCFTLDCIAICRICVLFEGCLGVAMEAGPCWRCSCFGDRAVLELSWFIFTGPEVG